MKLYRGPAELTSEQLAGLQLGWAGASSRCDARAHVCGKDLLAQLCPRVAEQSVARGDLNRLV